MPRKFRDKIKHSAQAFRRNAPKEGRGGKGTWGNPMDDIDFVERPPAAAIDEKDPNYDADTAMIDAWEEAVWHAEHEEYDDYFQGFDDEYEQPTIGDLAMELENAVNRAVESLVRQEKTPTDIFYDIVPQGGTLEAGGGTVLAKCILTNSLLNADYNQLLAEALNIFMTSLKIVSERDLDHAFIDALALPNSEEIQKLKIFADKLLEFELLIQTQVDELTKFSENDDPRAVIQGLKSGIKMFVDEYFTSLDAQEAISRVFELEYRFYQYEVVKILVSTSMDRDNKCRELASQLLGTPDVFDELAVRRAFEVLLERVDDLNKDVPDATGMLACFIARAISDEAIPPSFISEISCSVNCSSPTAIYCLQKAQHLLNMRLSAQRLARVWGPGRGRPVSELKDSISQLLKEYLANDNINELVTCLVELDEPNFHHEFVKQAIIKGADRGAEEVAKIQTMLELLLQKNILAPYQVSLGLRRLDTNMDNYKIDSPRLPTVCETIKTGLSSLVDVAEATN